jgi:hypothetical protein
MKTVLAIIALVLAAPAFADQAPVQPSPITIESIRHPGQRLAGGTCTTHCYWIGNQQHCTTTCF